MPSIRLAAITITAALVTTLSSTTIAQEPPPERESFENAFKEDSFSPYANRSFPSQVFWGDTHLHTSISMDAGAIGNRLGPEEAYRFARGEQVTSSTGVKAKLSRPWTFWLSPIIRTTWACSRFFLRPIPCCLASRR